MTSLRIHFTDVDLGRTRLKLEQDHMWEIVNSAHILQHREGGPVLDAWRRRVRKHVAANRALRGVVRTVVTVAPHATYCPDFLTPHEDFPDAESAIHAVLATPRQQLRAELGRLNTPHLAGLANAQAGALRELHASLRIYYREFIHPDAGEINEALRLDTTERMNTYLRQGTEAVLAALSPLATWRHPVLTVSYPVERDLYLAGRGLRLIPSYYCVKRPVALADPRLPPTLVYPITLTSRLLGASAGGGDRLAALLGPTRATILRAASTGSTTTILATQSGVAPATVSHHTTVLRNAGMIATRRHGVQASHHLTPLGLQVLAAGD